MAQEPTTACADDATTPAEPFGSLRRTADRLDQYYGRRRPTLLVGPTGCAKTTLVNWLMARYGLRPERAVGSSQMTPGDLLGRFHWGSEWRDGPLTRAVREGRPFFLDEVGLVPPDVLGVLFPLLDAHQRHLVINVRSEVVSAAPGFWFVAAYNPGYAGAGRDFTPAFRQRVRFLPVSYLPPDEEKELLVERTGLGAADAEFLVRVAEVTRTRLPGTLPEGASTRLLLDAAADLRDGLGREDVVRDLLLLPLTDDRDARQAALQALQAAGLFSIDELRRLQLADHGRVELPVADDDFFDAEAGESAN